LCCVAVLTSDFASLVSLVLGSSELSCTYLIVSLCTYRFFNSKELEATEKQA